MNLSDDEREYAADQLDQVLEQIQDGNLQAKDAEIAFLRGAVEGLRA